MRWLACVMLWAGLAIGAWASSEDAPFAASWGMRRLAITTAYTLLPADSGTFFDCGGGVSYSFGLASNVAGFHCAVYDSTATSVAINPSPGTIRTAIASAAASITLTPGQGVVLECDGTNWTVVSCVGMPTSIAALPALTGDVTEAAGTGVTVFRSFTADSILGRGANTSGIPTEIAAASDGDVLRRAGGVVGFGSITTAAISDYSTGTFTPTVTGGTVAGTNTYTIQNGIYTVIGTRVFYDLYVVMSAKDAAMSGAIRVSGLPFTSTGTAPICYPAPVIGGVANLTVAAGKVLVGEIQSSTSYVVLELNTSAGGVTSVLATDISATTAIRLSGSYVK